MNSTDLHIATEHTRTHKAHAGKDADLQSDTLKITVLYPHKFFLTVYSSQCIPAEKYFLSHSVTLNVNYLFCFLARLTVMQS